MTTAAAGAVAIVGIGCRFPGGVDSPQRYWELLARGGDAIVDAPPDRLDLHALYDPDPERPGRVYVRRGGYLDAIDRFDAGFFGISPREARRIDPQQRLLLEVAWEALEDGGLPADALAGSRTGVFVGIAGHDYADMQSWPAAREQIDAHVTGGGATSIAANRISYALDLRGPSMTVDTACSSALTAVHVACRSLAAGECDVALAGAVNALITAEPTIGFCKARMLAPDGRCKPFDAAADGYGRGEGAGVVALKPLARALADGDPIHAVIRATAINQDGRTAGISVPSPQAQEALLREALRAAGLEPGDVQVVEAHGTGTPVGDPREALAIGRVLGARPDGRPCLVGSAKGNLGHLEAAAGIAGLIKAALALQRRTVPPSVNFERPNPAIDFDGLGLRVPTALEPWPAPPGVPARAGVNSFGFGGANAHAIVEQPPPAPPPDDAPGDEPQLLALSARSPAALRELATRCAGWLRETDVAPRDACFTAAVRRSHHEQRLAAVGATGAELAGQLDAFAAGERRAAVWTGRAVARDGTPQVAFVFSGMGPQWWGMGRELLRDEPVFAAAIDACDEHLRPLAGWSLRAQLERGEAGSQIAEPYVAHVANLALQVALAALWRAWGIVPDAVVGHSSGEMGAACVAGALTLPDAVALAFHRGRLQHRTTGSGGMLAAAIAPGDVGRLLRGHEQRVSLAAVNGPASLTLSGELGALGEIADELERQGNRGRLLDVTVPYHGPQMDPLRDELLAALAGLDPRAPAIPLVSTVTGGWLNGEPLDAGYWWRNVRRPVHFADAVGRLIDSGYELFVELSPHPVLAPAVAACLEQAGRHAAVLASLRRGAGERATMLRALGALHVRGRPVHWPGVLRGAGRCVRMPTYPWQRERHWAHPPASVLALQGADSGHPLLGRRVRGARPAWEADLGDERLAFLDGHRIQERVTFPGAGHVELALAAARALGGDAEPVALEDVAFERLLGLGDGGATLLGCIAADRLEIHSARGDEPDTWTLRASARRVAAATPQPPPPLDLASLRARCSRPVDIDELYATVRERHAIGYTGAFRAVARLWGGDGEALAELALPAGVDADGWNVHPALLDAAFQVLGGAALGAAGSALLPVAIAHVALHEAPGRRCIVHAALGARDGDAVEGAVTLAGDDGRVLLRCERLRLREFGAAADDPPAGWLYEERWEPAVAPEPVASVASAAQIAAATATRLHADAAEAGFGTYYTTVEPALDALALGHVRAALRELGYDAARDGALDAGELGERLGVVGRQRRQLARLAQLAAQREPAPVPDADRLVAEHPAYASAVALVDESGRRLAATLRGQEDAREWLVAGEWRRTLGELYAVGPMFAVYGVAVAEAVAAAAARAPVSARILEVGAGTGGATGPILERLPAPAGEYVFSDLSPFFLRAAKARFGDRPELRTAIVDVEDPPAGEDGFDVVVAADVVHATADVRRALSNLRGLLAPGGALVLMEAARRSAWLDLVVGQLEGWWRAGDRDHPLLEPARWVELLGEAGFAEAVAVSDSAAEPAHAVIVATVPAARRARRRRLVLTDTGIGPELAATLRERGEDCVLAWPGEAYAAFGPDAFELDPADPAGWARLLGSAGEFDAVVDLWALDAPGDGASAGALMAFQRTSCGALVALTQALATLGRELPPTWLVTAGAQEVVAGEGADVAQAPLWGAGRVLRTERGSGRCRLVDVGARPRAAAVEALLAELETPPRAGEDEVALRDGQRLVRRLSPAALPSLPPRAGARVSPDDACFRAAIARPGALESLCLRAAARRPPAAGEVEIRVVAGALNFRDVLVALGLGFAAGDEDPAQAWFGWECAGVVVACGAGVDDIAPGDEVVAVAAGALGSRVATAAARVARKPAGLSFEQAATLPVGFLTARWALERLARLAAGERVLIHCASGGVGLAAVQIARRAGAEILATAGTPEKRAHLRALGIEHVMDSRTLEFAAEVRAATAGEGVDVVLNSLAGEAIDRSLELLRPFGRFVEIGKRAIYEDGRLALAPFRNNLSYLALDLHPLYAEQPAVIGAMLREVVADVEQGTLEPLPHHAFDVAEVEPAFRLMAQARHVGKVVLTLREPAYDVAPEAAPRLLRTDGAYLITGGLGGFGLQVARWMAREGAGHIVLTSRTGMPRDEDLPALEELLEADAQVHFVRADVRDAGTTARLLEYVRASVAPLRGVVHAAMVLDDALLGTLDYARFEAVLAPKLAGAWNLHELTAADELDLFVAFSSISLLIGQVSQSAYAAGNAFLAALAAHRRARGLPALTVDWGTIAGAGYVARQPGLEARMRRAGLAGIPAEDACAMLGELLRRDVTRMAVSRVDWSARHGAVEATPAEPAAVAARSSSSASLATRVRAAPRAERAAIVERYLRETTAVVLETSADRVDLDRPLPDMGIDSLMAVELRTAVRADLGVEVPIVDLLERYSLRALAAAVVERADG